MKTVRRLNEICYWDRIQRLSDWLSRKASLEGRTVDANTMSMQALGAKSIAEHYRGQLLAETKGGGK